MQPYIKTYLDYHNLHGANYYICECCGNFSDNFDIHHLIPRSKFGSKRRKERDDFSNLIGLCRDCHTKAHNEQLSKEYLMSKKKW